MTSDHAGSAKEQADVESVDELRARLAEAEETLRAIREGEVDAVVVSGSRGDQIFSLTGTEQVYRLFVETMNEAAVTLTFDGTILFANAQFGVFVGRPLEQVIGHLFDEFVAPDQHAAAVAMLALSRTQPARQRLVFHSADGTARPARISTAVLTHSIGPSICLIAADLTELEDSTELIESLRAQKEALAESEERFRLAAIATNDAIWDWDLVRGKVTWNKTYEDLFGRPPETGDSPQWWVDHIHPEDREQTAACLRDAIAAGRHTWSCEYRFQRVDGAWAAIFDRACLARDATGKATRVIGAMLDLTERKRAAQAVEDALDAAMTEKRRLEAVMAALPVGMAVTDAQGGNVLANRRFDQIWGGSRPVTRDIDDYAAYKAWWVDTGRPARPDEWASAQAVREGRAVLGQLLEIQGFDGIRRQVINSAAPIFDAAGRIVGSAIAIDDITELRQAQQSLVETRQRLALTASAARIGMFEWDVTTDTLQWTDALEVIFGYAPDAGAIVTTTNTTPHDYRYWSVRVDPEDLPRVEAHLRKCIEERKPYNLQYRIIWPDGSRHWVESRGISTHAEGERARLLGVVQDITERVRAEDALRRTKEELEERVRERTAELSRMVAELQIEVTRRTSAEGVLSRRMEQLRALAAELTLAEHRERRRLAETLHDELQQFLVASKLRMASLTRNDDEAVRRASAEVLSLLDQSIECSRSLTRELGPPALHESGLVAGMEWLATWMRQKHGLAVDIHSEGSIEVESEELRVLLFQSIRELLFNVVKHAKVSAAQVTLRGTESQIELTVTDDGAGFDPASVMSQQGRAGGFGLMSIRERLDLLGGRLQIESAAGRGSRFTLLAPRKSKETAKEEVATDPVMPKRAEATRKPEATSVPGDLPRRARAKTGKIRVLVVDDHIVVRRGLANLLKAEPGIAIVGEASDGLTAIEMIRRLMPDVVTMDISMPGMDGIEATRIIRDNFPGVRVIGLSMYEDATRARAMRDAGADDLLSKSGPAQALVTAIRACAAAPDRADKKPHRPSERPSPDPT